MVFVPKLYQNKISTYPLLLKWTHLNMKHTNATCVCFAETMPAFILVLAFVFFTPYIWNYDQTITRLHWTWFCLIFSAVSVLVLSSIELKMKQWNTDWNHSASCFVLLLMMAIFSSNLKTKKWLSVPGGLFLCLTGSMGGQTLLVLDLIPAVSLWRVTGQMVVSLIWKENTPLIHRGELLITIKYDWFMFRLLFIKRSFF